MSTNIPRQQTGPTLTSFINGRFLEASGQIRTPLVLPATGHVGASLYDAEISEINFAVEGAHHSLPAWHRFPQRNKALAECAGVMEKNRPHLTTLLMRNCGIPLRRARQEINAAITCLQKTAASPAPSITPPNPGSPLRYQRQGGRVVCFITSPDVSFLRLCQKLANALVLGNTLVLKLPTQSALIVAETLRLWHTTSLPRGVINFVHSKDQDVLHHLTQHPLVKSIVYLGTDHNAAAELAVECARLQKNFINALETKPSYLLLNNLLIEKIATELFNHCYHAIHPWQGNARILMPQEQFPTFLVLWEGMLEALVLASPEEETTDLGPLLPGRVATTLKAQEDAVAEGALRVTGGQVVATLGSGYLRPSLFAAPHLNHRCNRDDWLGVAVTPIKSLDEIATFITKHPLSALFGAGPEAEKALVICQENQGFAVLGYNRIPTVEEEDGLRAIEDVNAFSKVVAVIT